MTRRGPTGPLLPVAEALPLLRARGLDGLMLAVELEEDAQGFSCDVHPDERAASVEIPDNAAENPVVLACGRCRVEATN